MSQEPHDHTLIEEDDDLKSKTQLKAELKEIAQFGSELSELSITNLQKLPLNEKIIDAYRELERIKGHEARKRHFKRIGKLLREIDLEPIELAYARFKRGLPLVEVSQPSYGENWYKKLVEQKVDPETFIEEHPSCDRQQLRQLLRNAQKNPKKQKAKLISFLNSFQ